ncbi:MAG: hypothetical protein PHO54_05215, partial [Candidatus Peribacteraceae bacterium]|nr:hypothetical protein [Candidatus Peribacteraceae bacterium]
AIRPRPADLAQQIKKVNDEAAIEKRNLLEKANSEKATEDAKVTTHNTKITDKEKERGANIASVNKMKAELAAVGAVDPAGMKKLEAKAESTAKAVAGRKKESADAAKNAAATKKKFEAAQLPIETAEKNLAKERANLTEQMKLAREAIPGEKREYRDVAMTTVAAINDEGSYLWQNMKENKEDVSRMAELMQKKTDIFAEILQNGDPTSADFRQLFASIRMEHRFLRGNSLVAANGERLGKLLELQKTYGPKLLAVLARETKSVYEDPKATAEDRYNAYQREIMALQEFPEVGKARIDFLMKEVEVNLHARHMPLKDKANEAIQRSTDMGASNEVLQQAIDAINAEGTFLRRYGDRENRFAYLRETRQKINNKLTAQHGQEYYKEANELTAGVKNRAGRIETVQQLIESGKSESGKRATGEWKANVEELKQEQLRGLAVETDKVVVQAINNPRREVKMQALSALTDEAKLLYMHFRDRPQNLSRIVELEGAAVKLLDQIAEDTRQNVNQCRLENASPEHFRAAFNAMKTEFAMLTQSRWFQLMQPARSQEIQAESESTDGRLISVGGNAILYAMQHQSVAQIDYALKFLDLMEERIPITALAENRISTRAAYRDVRGDLAKMRAQNGETEGVLNAERHVEVQGVIDTVREHLRTIGTDSAEARDEPYGNAAERNKQLEMLNADKRKLQNAISSASEKQVGAINGLITQIDDAIPAFLKTPQENKKIFKGNFNLMVGEIRGIVQTMRQKVPYPSAEAYRERVKANRQTLEKAQGYVDVADDYGIAKAQVEALKELMADLQGVVTRDQNVIDTYKRERGHDS